MLMVVGQFSDAENRKLLLKKVRSSGSVKSAQLVRTKAVTDMYGSGLPEEQVKDDASGRRSKARSKALLS